MNSKVGIVLATVIVVSLAFTSMLFQSCKKKAIKYNDTTLIRPCDNVVCFNGGTCKDGLCICAAGFEGAQCKTPWNEKFVGTYVANDQCSVSNLYNVSIAPVAGKADGLNLVNLGTICSAATLNATITPEKTVFSIPMQKTCGDIYISGIGNINSSFINVSLVARDSFNHTSTQCSIILTKQ